MGAVTEEDFHATCRTCGCRGDLVETEDRDGRMWILLTCGHWQQAPRPGEVVLSDGSNRYEVWGTFNYEPANL